MKKIFTLITATLLSVSLFALTAKTALTVNASSKKNVTILVDGKTYNSQQKNDAVVINNIAVGSHNIKVYEQENSGNFWNSRSRALLYEGNVYVKPQSHTKVMINKAGRAMITERPISNMDYPSNSENGGWNARYPQAMNDRGFDRLRFTINQTSFENSKLGVAKEAIGNNYFTAEQVTTLLGSFRYESSKLEIAKFAYDRTLDQENYYSVMNGFNYSSTKEELSRFLQRAR